MQTRVEYIYDLESRNWCFRVPGPGIIGGADTREEAERSAIGAIAYALEGETEATEPGNGGIDDRGSVVRRDASRPEEERWS